MADSHDGSDDDEGGKNARTKSRRELPAGAVSTLKAWLLSPEHFTHPYPTPQDQAMLMQKTGIDKKQLKNWFTNARRRIWKPMLKKQLEQGKLSTSAPGAVPGVGQQMMVPQMAGGMGQPDQMAYQQGQMQQQQQMGQQEVAVDQYGNPIYTQRSVAAPGSSQSQYYDPSANAPMPSNASIGSLPLMGHSASGQQLSKTDSHAVLMELFARDQDLVRQATESAGLKSKSPSYPESQQQGETTLGQSPQNSSQHPMKVPSQTRLVNVPTLNSWPHFSSVSSLNNLGTMPGVRSITSLSGADLAKQGPVNTVDNLAQVKSVESMGKNDSYAFLEVFFGDRSSTALSSMAGSRDQRGIKRERDEDNDVGLSLEDETPSTSNLKQDSDGSGSIAETKASFMGDKTTSGTLKRAYDDALAARGLISVSRSCEKLTDLALPAKIQRTLSQEFLRQEQQAQQPRASWYPSTSNKSSQADDLANSNSSTSSQQYPGQHPGQHQNHDGKSDQTRITSLSADPNDANASVEVPSATRCALCNQNNVDTQLRPCGHMFHEGCLKPSLQSPMGPPKCPVDNIPIQSALLAVPTDENIKTMQTQTNTSSWRSSPSAMGQAVSAVDSQG
eukprot:scaffold2400_cov187-Cylindrotheca_fusiformis.AAC.6